MPFDSLRSLWIVGPSLFGIMSSRRRSHE
jgi:hypothetical protein